MEFAPHHDSIFFHAHDVQRAARDHAVDCFPAESVGFVIDGKYQPQENKAAEPKTSFEADFTEGIEAVIHSHTQRLPTKWESQQIAPSADDMRSQQATAVPWGIHYCDGNDCGPMEWFGDQRPFVAPYLKRSFLSGVRDCWALIRDIFRIEQGVVLEDLPRDHNWCELAETQDEWNLLKLETIEAAGFVQVDPAELQAGDVMISQVASRVPNHCGIFLKSGLALHHMIGRYSAREAIGEWRPYIKFFVRHQSLVDGAEWKCQL